MNYRISRRANTDIDAICNRIAKDNPSAAERLDERLHEAMQRLARFPRMGHTRADVADKHICFGLSVTTSSPTALRGTSLWSCASFMGRVTSESSSSETRSPDPHWRPLDRRALNEIIELVDHWHDALLPSLVVNGPAAKESGRKGTRR